MGVDPQLFIGAAAPRTPRLQQAAGECASTLTRLSPQDKAYAKLNPKQAYIEQRHEIASAPTIRPGGGSRGTWARMGQIELPDRAALRRQRHDLRPGQRHGAPPVLQRGTKAVPGQPGGQVQIVDAITGPAHDAGRSAAGVSSLALRCSAAPAGSRRLSPPAPRNSPQLRGEIRPRLVPLHPRQRRCEPVKRLGHLSLIPCGRRGT
jgi:hypothetical protein